MPHLMARDTGGTHHALALVKRETLCGKPMSEVTVKSSFFKKRNPQSCKECLAQVMG